MKIAITGGAGFIGTSLIKALVAQGHDVKWLDIVPSREFPQNGEIVDVRDESALTRALAGMDVIYHLAAEHRDDVRPIEKYYDVNVNGAKSLINAAEKCGIKTLIYTSTVAVYGLDAGESREDNAPTPFNDYGKSKLDGEKVFEDWLARDSANRLIIIRLVATFGPGNRGNIFNLIDQISRGKFIMIGSGMNRKSVAYLENVTQFLVHALNFKAGRSLYNYADKPDLNMRDMVSQIRGSIGLKGTGTRLPYLVGLMGGTCFDILAGLTGKRFPISAIRVRKFCANTIVNADKLEQTGFKRPFTLEQGLRAMVAAEYPHRFTLAPEIVEKKVTEKKAA